MQNAKAKDFPEIFGDLESIETGDLSKMTRSDLRERGGIFGPFFAHLADLISEEDTPEAPKKSLHPRDPPKKGAHPKGDEYVTGEDERSQLPV
jgi:hypothetical protein